MFSKFLPFIFCAAAATEANIAFRVPTSRKHGNKRNGSITKRKRRRERKGIPHLIGLKYLVARCGIQTWKWKLFPSALILFSCMAAITPNAHTHCYLRITNQTLWSLASVTTHCIKWELVSCQRTHLKHDSSTHLLRRYSLISLLLRIAQFLIRIYTFSLCIWDVLSHLRNNAVTLFIEVHMFAYWLIIKHLFMPYTGG